jgi:hypothetical protein
MKPARAITGLQATLTKRAQTITALNGALQAFKAFNSGERILQRPSEQSKGAEERLIFADRLPAELRLANFRSLMATPKSPLGRYFAAIAFILKRSNAWEISMQLLMCGDLTMHVRTIHSDLRTSTDTYF